MRSKLEHGAAAIAAKCVALRTTAAISGRSEKIPWAIRSQRTVRKNPVAAAVKRVDDFFFLMSGTFPATVRRMVAPLRTGRRHAAECKRGHQHNAFSEPLVQSIGNCARH